jgi:carboxylate-amine ligase
LSCGIENRGLQLINQACYFLPHILRYPLTPFWEGRQTGYKSFRTKVLISFQELAYQNISIRLPPMII